MPRKTVLLVPVRGRSGTCFTNPALGNDQQSDQDDAQKKKVLKREDPHEK